MPVQAPLWLEQCWQQEAGDNCPGMTDNFRKLRYELRLCFAVKLTSWVLEVESKQVHLPQKRHDMGGSGRSIKGSVSHSTADLLKDAAASSRHACKISYICTTTATLPGFSARLG